MNKSDLPSGKHYVLGFWRTPDGRVLLINKYKPDWQKGLWNGLGGSVEQGESIHKAMVREFYEEAGIETSILEWFNAATIQFPNAIILDVFIGGGELGLLDFNDECDEGYLALHNEDSLPASMERTAYWLYHMVFDESCAGSYVRARIPNGRKDWSLEDYYGVDPDSI